MEGVYLLAQQENQTTVGSATVKYHLAEKMSDQMGSSSCTAIYLEQQCENWEIQISNSASESNITDLTHAHINIVCYFQVVTMSTLFTHYFYQ